MTIGERGQIVVPAEARKEFGLEVGDKLLVFSRHHGIVLMKADDVMQYVERTLANLTEMRAVAAEPGAGDALSDDDDEQRGDDEPEKDPDKAAEKAPGRRGKRGGADA